MEIVAKHRYAKISAQKARLVADLIRGLPVERAINILSFSAKKAAKLIVKIVDSAIANADHNYGIDVDELKVSRIFVNTGPMSKRMHARAKGSGSRIDKSSCHITVIVSND